MSQPTISVRNVSKKYRLGTVGMTTLRDELQRVWARIRGDETALEKGLLLCGCLNWLWHMGGQALLLLLLVLLFPQGIAGFAKQLFDRRRHADEAVALKEVKA